MSENLIPAERLEFANQIGSRLAEFHGIKPEQFIPVPTKSNPSNIRHASGLFKILLLEYTDMPLEEIQHYLGLSGSQSGMLSNAGAFKDRLLLSASPHHVVSAETSQLKLDTIIATMGLKQHRELRQRPYTGKQKEVTGLGTYPPYELIHTASA